MNVTYSCEPNREIIADRIPGVSQKDNMSNLHTNIGHVHNAASEGKCCGVEFVWTGFLMVSGIFSFVKEETEAFQRFLCVPTLDNTSGLFRHSKPCLFLPSLLVREWGEKGSFVELNSFLLLLGFGRFFFLSNSF